MEYKISVIAIFYNSEQYVKRCLDSILSQKKVYYEVICIDDCSSDSTPAILNYYASKYKCIRVISHEKNKGISAARNSGLINVSGDCFYLIDGDDYLTDDNSLYELIKYFDKDTDWVQGSYLKCDDNGNYISTIKFPVKKYHNNKDICKCFDSLNFIYTHNKLINSKYADHLFETDMFHEDRMWIANIFNKLNKIISTDKITYNYVVHEGQTSTKARSSKTYIESGIKLMNIMADCPACWSKIRDTFQIVDIEKPLFYWGKGNRYKQTVMNEIRQLNAVSLNIAGFPRATKYIHIMIEKNIPFSIINLFAKTYVKTMEIIGHKI